VYDSMLKGDADQKARGYRSLGLVAMAEGHYTEAIDRFRQAILYSLAPNHQLTEARNRLFLANAEQEKGWRDSASAQIREAYALFKTSYFEPAFLMFLGKALARDGQATLAHDVLDSLQRRARADNPQDRVNRQVVEAEVALANGNAQRALGLLTEARAVDSSAYVRESLAYAMSRGGRLPAAAALYDSVAGSTSQWYGWEAESYVLSARTTAGRLYESAGDAGRARAAHERALARWQQGDTDLVSTRASREALARLRRASGTLTPSSR
jgi:tetratricopeptide (TPR) repeat protein